MMELPAGHKRVLTVEEFDAMIHPDDLGALRAAADPANAHGGTIQNEFRLMLPSGSVRWMRSHWRFETGDGPPDASDRGHDRYHGREEYAGRVAGGARRRRGLRAHAARQAERLEQDRKTILELVAKDQPLDQIVTTMAHADRQSPSWIVVLDPDRIDRCFAYFGLFPQFPQRLATALDRVAIASIHETLSSEPIATLSSDPEWLQFIETSRDFPFQHYRAVPILRNTRIDGDDHFVLCAEIGRTAQAEEKLLESWGQFASLAVERRGLYEQLSFRAQYDSLTTLLNRASLYDRLDAQICKTGANGGAMAVVYLDLDRFKEINDRYGHGAGDKVLQHVSRRILESVRHTDFAARIGGDEFVVILPGVSDRKEASRVAELVVNAIAQPSSFNGRELRVGASFGISIYPDDGAHTDALLKMADEDMYRAKLRRFRPEHDSVSPALLSA